MKKSLLITQIVIFCFSCEEPIESFPENDPVLSLNSLIEDVSLQDEIPITINFNHVPIPIFGAYLTIEMDTTKIEILDDPGFQIGEFWSESSISFEKFENGFFHLTIVLTENITEDQYKSDLGLFYIKSLNTGSTELTLKSNACEFYNAQGEIIEIPRLVLKSIVLNIN